MIVDVLARIGRHPIHEFRQTTEELIDVMNKYNIGKSFLLPFPTMEIKKNNDLIAQAIKEHPDRLVGFAGINPQNDDSLKEIERVVGLGFKGLMIDIEFHKEILRNLPKLDIIMVPCLENNLPVLINTENIFTLHDHESYFNLLNNLVFKFPEVRFIVNFRWPRIKEILKTNRNIAIYTGGHHNTPGIIPLMAEIGPTRICMGTESPVNHPGLTILDINRKKIHPIHRELVLGKNAERIFKDLFR